MFDLGKKKVENTWEKGVYISVETSKIRLLVVSLELEHSNPFSRRFNQYWLKKLSDFPCFK